MLVSKDDMLGSRYEIAVYCQYLKIEGIIEVKKLQKRIRWNHSTGMSFQYMLNQVYRSTGCTLFYM